MNKVMSLNDFADKVTTLEGGESFVYFTGDLAAERYIYTVMPEGARTRANEVNSLGDLAYKYATLPKPLGFLTQERSVNGFAYIFTKKLEKKEVKK